MITEFQREDRYIVIKRSDLKKVPVNYRSHLVEPMFSLLSHLPHRECLVIESDWPEFEPAWAAIEARVSGKPAEQRLIQLKHERANRVYIAGPMTGLPDFNFPAFNAMAATMRAEGWHVENPAEHGIVDGAEWGDYLRYDIGRLATCEAVTLLPGWSKSRGACLEVNIARQLDMPIMLAEGAEQDQGEPVGWASQEYIDKLRSGQCNGIMIHDQKHGRFHVPLYPHADPGEVERLRSIERSYGLREALLEQVKGERDRMIARTLELADQLADRDALLGRWVGNFGHLGGCATPLRDETKAVLSANAEPSATVDCAVCRDLGDQCVECEEAEFREWAARHFASADYRKTAAGLFIQDWMRHAYAAWCARAALARKA